MAATLQLFDNVFDENLHRHVFDVVSITGIFKEVLLMPHFHIETLLLDYKAHVTTAICNPRHSIN